MTDRREVALAAGVLVTVGAMGVPTVLHSPSSSFDVVAAVSLVAAGAVLRTDSSQRRAGLLLYVAAVCVMLSDIEVAFGIQLTQLAYMTLWWAVVPLMLVLLMYPGRRLARRWHRWLVAATVLDLVVLWGLDGFLWDPRLAGEDGSWWVTVGGLEDVRYPWVYQGKHVGGILLPLVACFALAQRWRGARGQSRTAVRTVSAVGFALAVSVAVRFVSLVLSDYEQLPGFAEATATLFQRLGFLTLAVAPLGLLIEALRRRAGQVRVLDELLAAGSNMVRIRDVLRRALADPSMDLMLAVTGRDMADQSTVTWLRIDDEGPRQVTAPEEGVPGRRHLLIRTEGTDILAVLDCAEEPEPDEGQVHTILAAAAVVLENQRLQAALLARLVDLRDSRARIVEAGMQERRRVERDLHDGAQQMLLTVASSLGRIERAGEDSFQRGAALRDARRQLADALAELRRLARGIHPAVLTQAGLGPALSTLGDGTSIPVLVRDNALGDHRPPPAVEATAWFVAAESVTNAVKHAGATEVVIDVTVDQDALTLAVWDDGAGGATPVPDGGLAGLADRVGALGGRLTVASPPGAGTTVTAVIPCVW